MVVTVGPDAETIDSVLENLSRLADDIRISAGSDEYDFNAYRRDRRTFESQYGNLVMMNPSDKKFDQARMARRAVERASESIDMPIHYRTGYRARALATRILRSV